MAIPFLRQVDQELEPTAKEIRIDNLVDKVLGAMGESAFLNFWTNPQQPTDPENKLIEKLAEINYQNDFADDMADYYFSRISRVGV